MNLDNLTREFGFFQLIDSPTRISESSSSTIDLLFTSFQDIIAGSGCLETSLSDHRCVFGSVCYGLEDGGPKLMDSSYK